ncbi:type III-B CRISPR module-associated protein Cmr3 [candidate division WOR-3 bacterium]|nr:type III-B CRISPR module-associated protein Cmr3 [candidate division WOR-3 bacterium]
MGIVIKPFDVAHFGTGKGSSAADVHSIESFNLPTHFTLAGALRSEILRRKGKNPEDLGEYLNKKEYVDDYYDKLLYSPEIFGPYIVSEWALNSLNEEMFLPLPFNIYKISKKQEHRKGEEYIYAYWKKIDNNLITDLETGIEFLPWVRKKKRYEFQSGFLSLDSFKKYLMGVLDNEGKLEDNSIFEVNPIKMSRPGIKIKSETGTVEEGHLYFEEYVYFAYHEDDNNKEFYLYIESALEDELFSEDKKDGLMPLGGENRYVQYKQVEFSFKEKLDKVKEDVINAICEASPSKGEIYFNLVLLTPAYFKNGWKPEIPHVEIVGATLERPLKYSGWDMATNTPAPTRSFVRPGSIYLCRTKDKGILGDLYLSSISDEYSGLGLGIVVPGVPKIYKNKED